MTQAQRGKALCLLVCSAPHTRLETEMKHEKVGVTASGEAICSCGEVGFDHIRYGLLRRLNAQPVADACEDMGALNPD
jgi:hypothetical protein